MEEFPRPLFETPDPGKSETGSKRRKKDKIRLPRLASVESSGDKDKAPAPDANELHNSAQGFIEQEKAKFKQERLRKAEKAAKKAKDSGRATEPEGGQPQVSQPEGAVEQQVADADAPSTKEHTAVQRVQGAEAAQVYEKLPAVELEPAEFSGGEVIIHLQGDGPVEEHVIPLRPQKPTAVPRPALIRGEPIVFQQQPEQQQQAQEQSGPPSPEPANRGDNPEVQPARRTEAAYDGPDASSSRESVVPLAHEIFPAAEGPEQAGPRSSEDTADTHDQPVHAAAIPALPVIPHIPGANPTELMVSQRDLEAVAHQARQAGASRGLVTGLLVGGAYEHIKHRRRAKRKEKTMKEQIKKIQKLEEARESYTFTSEEQLKKQSRTEAKLQQLQRKLSVQSAAAAIATQRFETQPTVSVAAERPGTATSRSQGARTEQSTNVTRIERPVPFGPGPEQATAQSQSAGAEQTVQGADGHIAVPDGHMINTEGWVITEIDKATGKVVEKPTFEYGHEFYRERAQESTPTSQRNAAAGEVALVAAAMSQSRSAQQRNPKTPDSAAAHGGTASMPQGREGSAAAGSPASSGGSPPVIPGYIPSATTQGSPGGTTAQSTGSSSKTAKSGGGSSSDQPLWPWFVALGVVILLIVLIR